MADYDSPDAVYFKETQTPPPAPPPIVPAPPVVPVQTTPPPPAPGAPNIAQAAGGAAAMPAAVPPMPSPPPPAPVAPVPNIGAASAPPIPGTGLRGEEAMLPEISADIKRRQKEEDEARQRQGKLDQEQQDALKAKSEGLTREQQEMGGIYDQMRAEYAKGTPQLKQQDIPEYKKPIAPPEQLLTSMGVMAALSALFGAASRGPYSGAIAAMTGAMQGWQQRDDKMVEQSMKEYAENVARIKGNNEALKTEWEAAKEEHKNNIEGLLSAAKGIAVKYDLGEVGQADIRLQRADKAAAALDKHVDSMQRGIDNAFKLKETILDHIAKAEQQKAKLAQDEAGYFDWDTAVFTVRRMLAGESGASLGMGTGKTGSYNRALVTRAADYLSKTEHWGPEEFSRAQAKLKAITSAERQNETRAVAVKRLTGTMEDQWAIITELANQGAGPTGMPAADAPWNAIRRNLGDKDLGAFEQALSTLAMQYREAMTMPGSNAQMHEGSRLDAQKWMNSNQPFRVLESVYSTMRREVQAADRQYARIADEELQKIGHTRTVEEARSEVKQIGNDYYIRIGTDWYKL